MSTGLLPILTDVFWGFPHSLQADARNGTEPSSSTFFPVHHSLYAIVVVNPLLNKPAVMKLFC
jgi:hypothetical protein